MNIQAINYKPIRAVSFAGERKESPSNTEAPESKVTLKKTLKVGFILGSAVASYGVFKTLAPKAVLTIANPIKKIWPSEAISKGLNTLKNKKFVTKTYSILKYPFAKIKQASKWLFNKIHTPIINKMKSGEKSTKVLNGLNQVRDFGKRQTNSFIDNIKKTKIGETLTETGSVIAAIGGGAEAADAVSAKKIEV